MAFFFEPGRREVLPSMGDDVGRRLDERRNRGDEAVPEGFGVERGEDVAEVIMCRHSIGERPQAAQEGELLLAKARDVGEGLGAGQHREQAQEQDLIERINDLAGLTRVRHIFEIYKKNRRFDQSRIVRARMVRRPFSVSNQRMSTDSAQFRSVTYFFTRLPLAESPRRLAGARNFRRHAPPPDLGCHEERSKPLRELALRPAH
nr:hypothetical protein [Methylocystis heyeri]